MLKKAMKTNEFFVLIALVVLCLIIGIANPVFFTTGNVVSLMKNSIVSIIISKDGLITIILRLVFHVLASIVP